MAWRRHQQIFARPDYKRRAPGYIADATIIDDDAMEFGQLYRSAVIVGGDPDISPAMRPNQWAGRPGTRAPHLWVEHEGARVSTLDLFQSDWVLLAECDGWRESMDRVANALNVHARCLVSGADVRPYKGSLAEAFGISSTGASLIRPDGYIAWRSHDLPADAEAVLNSTFAAALAS